MGRGATIDWQSKGPEVERLLKNHSAPQVSKLTGIKATSINNYCGKKGIKIRKHNNHKVKNSHHDINLMILLRVDGMSVEEVAEKFDTTVSTVYCCTGKAHKLLKRRLDGMSIKTISVFYNIPEGEIKTITDKLYKQVIEGRV